MRRLDQLEQIRLACAILTSVLLLWLDMASYPEAGFTYQVIILVPFVVLLGLPHGCLDVEMARSVFALKKISQLAMFLIGYLLLAFCVVGLWYVVPVMTILAFLAYSAIHFSSDWAHHPSMVGRWSAGTAIVGLPCAFHRPIAEAIFAVLVPAEWAGHIVAIAGGAALLALPVALLTFLFMRGITWLEYAEFLWLASLAFLVSPLMYFAIYFCLSHSPKHYRQTIKNLKFTPMQAAQKAFPIWLITVIGCCSILFGLDQFGTEQLLQLVFITLAALTVPHMIVSARFDSTLRR